MKYGSIRGIDKPVSRVIQGTMMLRESKVEDGFALLDAADEAGVRAFDTAHVYSGGQCEKVLGAWVRARNNLDRAVIITKGCHPMEGRRRVTPDIMWSDLEESLARLGLPYVDLWLFHRDDPAVPMERLVETANLMVESGKILAYGVSNWTPERIDEACRCAESRNLLPPAATSPQLSVLAPVEAPWADCTTVSGKASAALRHHYVRSGLSVLGWSPLAGGFLSGRVNRHTLLEVPGCLPEYAIRVYASEENWLKIDRLEELGRARRLTIPEMALAYVTSQGENFYAITGAASAQEVRSNARAVDTELTPKEIAYLDQEA